MNALNDPIIIKQSFDASVESVWSALTNLKEMQQWYFPQLTSFEPKIGFETRFTIEHEGRVFPHIWKITEVDAPHKITYQWTFDGYSGVGLTTFTLEKENGKTNLTIFNPTLEPFPDDIPEFKRESGVEGWNYLIKKSLVEYLS